MADVRQPVQALGQLGTELGDALKKLGQSFQDIGKVLSFGLLPVVEKLAVSLGQTLLNAIRPLVDLGARVGRVLAPVVSGLAGIAAAGAAAGSAVVKFGQSLVQFVALANPVAAERFTLAMRDLMAVVGGALAPVLEVVTDLVRAFADSIASFAGDLGGTLAAVLKPLAEILKVVFDIFADVGQLLAEVFKAIAPVIILVAQGIKAVVEFLYEAVKTLLSLIGVDLKGRKEGASVGAAVRQASTSSVEDVVRRARESAFTLGTGGGGDPAKKAAEATERAANLLADIKAAFTELPERIARAVVGDRAVDAAIGARNWTREKLRGVRDWASGERDTAAAPLFHAAVAIAREGRAVLGDAAGAVGPR